MEKKIMTISDIVNDLKELQEYFKAESGGSYPLCLEAAIDVLEALKKLKEV